MARNGFFMQTQFIRCYVSGIGWQLNCRPNEVPFCLIIAARQFY
jgi:hypothetical protein